MFIANPGNGAALPIQLLENAQAIDSLVVLDSTGVLYSAANQKSLEQLGLKVLPAKTVEQASTTLASQTASLLLVAPQHAQSVYQYSFKNKWEQSPAGILMLGSEHKLTRGFGRAKLHTPILVVEDAAQTHAAILQSRRFANGMRQQGLDARFVLLPPVQKQMFSRLTSRGMLMRVLKLMLGKSDGNRLHQMLAGYWYWQEPPLDYQGLLQQKDYLNDYPLDPGVNAVLEFFYKGEEYQLKQWPLRNYQAFDLKRWSKDKPYVALRNKQGQLVYLDMQQYAPYDPVIVTGLDDETNLYRLVLFYQTRQQYTWINAGPRPKMSARPLGAFLHFRKPVPKELQIPLLMRSNLSLAGIELLDNDPQQPLTPLPDVAEQKVRSNCIHCHSVAGLGGRGHHLVAFTGKPQPGNALPLLSYSDEVFERFLFQQDEVAAVIGVTPNRVAPEIARALLDWHRSQKANQKPN